MISTCGNINSRREYWSGWVNYSTTYSCCFIWILDIIAATYMKLSSTKDLPSTTYLSSHTRVTTCRKIKILGLFWEGGGCYDERSGKNTVHDSEQTITLSDCFSISNPFLLKVGSGNETKDTHSLTPILMIQWNDPMDHCSRGTSGHLHCWGWVPRQHCPAPSHPSTPPAITLWFKHDWPPGCTLYYILK